MKKKTEMLTLNLTQSYFRSPCLPGRMKLSGSGTEATMFSQFASSWWPSLVLLMFWTDFLSFGEMFDLVYFNYCPSFLFFPISLERCKTKENINTSWLSIRWSPPGGMTWLLETKINNVTRSCLSNCLEFHWNFQDPSRSIEYQNKIWPAEP